MIDKKHEPAKKCPVCQQDSVTTFLTREGVPVHQNLLVRDQRSALETVRGTLSLAACERCGFVFNETFEPSLVKYGEDYDNTQTFSRAFEDYLSELVRYLVFERGVQNCRVVEVGCGKGRFLRKLVQVGRNIGYGFDPSYVGPLTDLGGRVHFERVLYGPERGDVQADVVVCRHVIEHVPDPLNLLYAIRQALTNSPRAYVFVETPTVEWILRNRVFWDFFYEHCSYFTATSLTTAFEASGFKVENVQARFGGQYLWLEARLLSPEEKPNVRLRPGSVPRLAKEFALSESELKGVWEAKIRELLTSGRVALWGAGAKGVTFANLIDPGRQLIACVVDLNPRKQGHYIPGTSHPIVDYHELPLYEVDMAILMNPNYREENLRLLHEAKINIRLLDLMDGNEWQT